MERHHISLNLAEGRPGGAPHRDWASTGPRRAARAPSRIASRCAAPGSSLRWVPMSPLAALTSAPALRDDIRRLGDLLGEALIRQEGPATYEIVERIRALSRDDPDAAAALIDELPLARGDHPGPGVLAVLPPGQHRRTGAPVASADRRSRQHRWPPGRGGGGDPCRPGGRGRDRRRGRRRIRPDQRAPGLHRPSDRGVPPLGAGQAASHRRAARRAPHRPHRPRDRRSHRPPVADRRTAPGAARGDRRGAKRPVLPRRPGRRGRRRRRR